LRNSVQIGLDSPRIGLTNPGSIGAGSVLACCLTLLRHGFAAAARL
jgi:hypothetical protein